MSEQRVTASLLALSVGALALSGCGGAGQSAGGASRAPASVPEAAEDTDDGWGSGDAREATVEHTVLGGRFAFTLPESITVQDDDVLGHGERWRRWYDGRAITTSGCTLSLAVRSDGRLRPAEGVTLESDMQRVPSTQGPSTQGPSTQGLEIVTRPNGSIDTLGDALVGPAAVLFEADGTATDLVVAPRLEDGMEPAPWEDESLTWAAAQRADPRQAHCFAVADTVLANIVLSVRALAPFAGPDAVLPFGFDPQSGEPRLHRGVLPEGWVITHNLASDAEMFYVHPRPLWAWSQSAPEPRAEIWSFVGDEGTPERAVQRVRLFGLTLRLSREGCARHESPEVGVLESVCLHGDAATRRTLLEVLERFEPVTPSS